MFILYAVRIYIYIYIYIYILLYTYHKLYIFHDHSYILKYTTMCGIYQALASHSIPLELGQSTCRQPPKQPRVVTELCELVAYNAIDNVLNHISWKWNAAVGCNQSRQRPHHNCTQVLPGPNNLYMEACRPMLHWPRHAKQGHSNTMSCSKSDGITFTVTPIDNDTICCEQAQSAWMATGAPHHWTLRYILVELRVANGLEDPNVTTVLAAGPEVTSPSLVKALLDVVLYRVYRHADKCRVAREQKTRQGVDDKTASDDKLEPSMNCNS